MGHRTVAIAKKIFSLTLILNALITIASIAQILYNYLPDFPNWQPYSPYLPNGTILLLIIPAAVLNIYLSSKIGRSMHTGRIFFHHYVYGFLVIVFSVIFALALTSVSLPLLFLVYTSDIAVNASRFLLLAGLALLLDDVQDVSVKVGFGLKRLELKAYQYRKVFHWVGLLSGLVSWFVFAAVTLWTTQHLNLALEASVMVGTFLVTSLNSLMYFKRGEWLKMKISKNNLESLINNFKPCPV